ncbi:hypothetical protein [Pseudooctadecabacter jejudonensis]|uniref:Uncharacterized protein n=1 Tax=Pseudooctadecabacter jejudonensis TaxID=1391910 RepID=A0A1Y5RF30_9RHOB|nr:hypothetical protein [Pseudooctadecabacter jejudonensis]SLN14747.1 hypothetical protein PSJ8397_00300 [Pseudooctadecabacter jejudonensis]
MIDAFLNGLWADRFLVAGVLAGLLGLMAFAPYIRDILSGQTQPDRACWLIWAVLASISGASNLYEGASTSMVFVGVQVLGTLAVFGLSVRYGSGHLLGRSNIAILTVAGIGLIVWAVMETAAVALAISIAVSALGGAATAYKAYHAPHSETVSAWMILLVSSVLGVASVGTMDLLLLAYPVYLALLYAGILMAQMCGQAAQNVAQAEAAHADRRLTVPPVTRAGQPRLGRRHAPTSEAHGAHMNPDGVAGTSVAA